MNNADINNADLFDLFGSPDDAPPPGPGQGQAGPGGHSAPGDPGNPGGSGDPAGQQDAPSQAPSRFLPPNPVSPNSHPAEQGGHGGHGHGEQAAPVAPADPTASASASISAPAPAPAGSPLPFAAVPLDLFGPLSSFGPAKTPPASPSHKARKPAQAKSAQSKPPPQPTLPALPPLPSLFDVPGWGDLLTLPDLPPLPPLPGAPAAAPDAPDVSAAPDVSDVSAAPTSTPTQPASTTSPTSPTPAAVVAKPLVAPAVPDAGEDDTGDDFWHGPAITPLPQPVFRPKASPAPIAPAMQASIAPASKPAPTEPDASAEPDWSDWPPHDASELGPDWAPSADAGDDWAASWPDDAPPPTADDWDEPAPWPDDVDEASATRPRREPAADTEANTESARGEQEPTKHAPAQQRPTDEAKGVAEAKTETGAETARDPLAPTLTAALAQPLSASLPAPLIAPLTAPLPGSPAEALVGLDPAGAALRAPLPAADLAHPDALAHLRQHLHAWVAAGQLRELDLALADLLLDLASQAPPTPAQAPAQTQPVSPAQAAQPVPSALPAMHPLALLGAVLASHQLGRGHVCLDLAACLRHGARTLAWHRVPAPQDASAVSGALRQKIGGNGVILPVELAGNAAGGVAGGVAGGATGGGLGDAPRGGAGMAPASNAARPTTARAARAAKGATESQALNAAKAESAEPAQPMGPSAALEPSEAALLPTPMDWLQGIDLPQWQAVLAACSQLQAVQAVQAGQAVQTAQSPQAQDSAPAPTEADAGASPLVLQGARLYLRRQWQDERSVRAAIVARVGQAGQLRQRWSAPRWRAALDALFGAPQPAPQAAGPATHSAADQPALEPAMDWQRAACALAASQGFCIITGGPGTGKTTTVVKLLALLQAMALAPRDGDAQAAQGASAPGAARAASDDSAHDTAHGTVHDSAHADRLSGGQPLRIALAAPTGKAAARLGESIASALQRLQLDALAQALNVPSLVLPAWDGSGDAGGLGGSGGLGNSGGSADPADSGSTAIVRANRPAQAQAAPDRLRAAIPSQAQTLHRLLGPRADSRHFWHHAHNPLPVDVLVVDEASMVDLDLMARLMAALPAHARLVLLGDKDQLASVEAGAVLGELCSRAQHGHFSPATVDWLQAVTGQRVPPQLRDAQGTPLDQAVVMLRHSHRFGADSGIGRLAAAVNAGQAAAVARLRAQPLADLQWLAAPSADAPALAQLLLTGQPGPEPEPRHEPRHEPRPAQALDASTRDASRTRQGYAHYLRVMHEGMAAWQADQGAGDGERSGEREPERERTGWEQGQGWREGDGQAPASSPSEDALNAWALRVLTAHRRFQLLCALREGPWGVSGLNRRIARMLANAGLIAPQGSWWAGRPVLVTGNDYGLGLMNGDIGVTLQRPDRLAVAFADATRPGGVRWVAPSRLTQLETVFAMTVHKSQGSEFAHTALVIPPRWGPVLTRELVYTGITRASQWCSIVMAGSQGEAVLEMAVKRRVLRASGLLAGG